MLVVVMVLQSVATIVGVDSCDYDDVTKVNWSILDSIYSVTLRLLWINDNVRVP